MRELIVLALFTIGILVYEIIEIKKENRILNNNYQTALRILSEQEPELAEYLRKEGKL